MQFEPIPFRFNVVKSTQAAAFLLRMNGGDMDKYLFIKMLYLADRAAIEKWGDPITGDIPVSMEHGPVLSLIYDLTKGDCPQFHSEWSQFVSDADWETNQVFLVGDPGTDDLSRAEQAILKSVFEAFRNYSWKEMKDYSHKLQEYEEVGKGSKRIAFSKLLRAVGKNDQEITACFERIKQVNIAEALLT
jgi:uncharacterized phage-associated protein